MKQIKRRLAVLLAFAIAISGITIGVSRAGAENPLTVYGEAVVAMAGKEVKIPVMVKDNHGVAGLALKVTYDATVMTPVKAEKGSLISGLANLQFGDTIANHKDSSFECVAYNDSNFSDNGELFVLTFQMADAVSDGAYSLKMELTEHYNEALADIETGCEDIKVTVGTDTSTKAPSASPTAPATAKPGAKNNFDVYIFYANKEMTDWIAWDENYCVKVTKDGTYRISYKAKKAGADIFVLTLDTLLKVVPDSFSISPKTLTVGKTSYPLGISDPGYDSAKNFRMCIRNPYMKGSAGSPVNRALGNKVIPVKVGDTISVDFTVSGIAGLDMSKNPGASVTKKPAASPANKPSGSSSSTKTKKRKLIEKPGKVKIKKLIKSGKGCAKVTWGKVKCTDGYQIQYSRSKYFTSKKKDTSYSRSCYIFGKSKKTYYVGVRAVNWGYTSQSWTGYKYGSWSKVKKVKLK